MSDSRDGPTIVRRWASVFVPLLAPPTPTANTSNQLCLKDMHERSTLSSESHSSISGGLSSHSHVKESSMKDVVDR